MTCADLHDLLFIDRSVPGHPFCKVATFSRKEKPGKYDVITYETESDFLESQSLRLDVDKYDAYDAARIAGKSHSEAFSSN